MDLDLRLVRYAVALADELHYAKAAARLHIAQQTLSAQINQLETRLGQPLFVRDRRHVELTKAGEVFVGRGRALLADAEDLLSELEGVGCSLRLDVITDGLSSGVIARELRRLLADVTLEVIQGHGLTAAVPAVADGRLDLALGWVEGLQEPLPSSLGHELVRLEPVGVVLPAHHPLAEYEQLPISALVDHPLVLHTAHEAPDWENWNEQAARAFGIPIGWRLHGQGRGSAMAAVLAYDAPAFGPLEGPLLEGLVVRELVDPVPLMPMSIVWRSRSRLPSHLDRAIAAIRQIAKRQKWMTKPSQGDWIPTPCHPT